MKCLVVLSHLMSKDCDLGKESIARSKLAIEYFSSGIYDFLITIGWDYRSDCSTPIADVVRTFILNNSKIDKSVIIPLTSSRDTVGDAYYSLDYLRDSFISEAHIVTSDYHVERATKIFNLMLNNCFKVKVFGTKTEASNDPFVLQHEKQSIEAFDRTFDGVDFSSRNSVYHALSTRHPFYNGEIYPKI